MIIAGEICMVIMSDWKNSVFIKTVADIEKLKKSQGSDIQVRGSGKLIQLLRKNDLNDELWLKIYPLTLGKGKKLFDHGTIPAFLSGRNAFFLFII
jgi:dihydrofolate reductase